MPVARFLRLLMTLVVLMSGLVSALSCGVVESTGVHSGRARATSTAPNVGELATSSAADTFRASSHGRGGLLSVLTRALGDAPADSSDAEQNDEFEVGDSPDLADDDGPQGFVVVAFSGLFMPRLAALSVEPNLWGIQPSIGHPRADDEPPRV
jgi:hypothetical protein